jgi:hypothetical protein
VNARWRADVAWHLPAELRGDSWKHVADRLYVAARDGNVNDAVVALRLALQLEQVPRLPP